jgi:hypothetical protein
MSDIGAETKDRTHTHKPLILDILACGIYYVSYISKLDVLRTLWHWFEWKVLLL